MRPSRQNGGPDMFHASLLSLGLRVEFPVSVHLVLRCLMADRHFKTFWGAPR